MLVFLTTSILDHVMLHLTFTDSIRIITLLFEEIKESNSVVLFISFLLCWGIAFASTCVNYYAD